MKRRFKILVQEVDQQGNDIPNSFECLTVGLSWKKSVWLLLQMIHTYCITHY